MAASRTVHIHLESRGQTWDHVHVQSFSGREAISEPFLFELRVVCTAGQGLPEGALPGEAVTAVIEVDDQEVRRVHGILEHIYDHLTAPEERAVYDLRIVPRAHRLTLVEMQEIYLGRSVPDILRAKLDLNTFGPDESEFRLLDTYPARDIVVQYRESDLAFVSRLTEHAGISYFFDHGAGCDRLVFTDHPAGFRPLAGLEEVLFRPRGEKRDVFSLGVATEMVPTSYVIQDYNYRTPLVDLSAVQTVEEGTGGGLVEYGSHAKTPAEAERLALVRAQERRCRQRVLRGASGRPELYAGLRAALADHPRLAASEPLLFTEVVHEAYIPVYDDDQRAASYTNRFVAIPGDRTYRPPRRTPRPRMTGVLTGIVQPGPDGEKGGVAQMDSDGRYTVQFHFDTAAPGEQKASHPVRMAQPFAGPDYGMNFPLRRGTEVLIAFTDGDPDRPVIVGALYNAASPSPVAAANAARHQIKSATGSLFEMSSKS